MHIDFYLVNKELLFKPVAFHIHAHTFAYLVVDYKISYFSHSWNSLSIWNDYKCFKQSCWAVWWYSKWLLRLIESVNNLNLHVYNKQNYSFYSFSQTDLKMETGFLFCYEIYEQFYRLRVEIEIGKWIVFCFFLFFFLFVLLNILSFWF